tara:strand:+ start:32117 stop:33046 length:930 start_codon:yes stop_codon:yes gene_type:complete
METTNRDRQWITPPSSKLTLGTVQFGLDYGVANQTGRPSYRNCLAIIEKAYTCGIRYFDTAAAYGTSEEVLGKALRELGIANEVVVISKSVPLPQDSQEPRMAKKLIESSLRKSLQNLELDQIPIYLLHRESDLPNIESLSDLREKGLIGRIGVSVDTPEGANRASKEPLIDAVQLPHNLLDRRFEHQSWLSNKAPEDLLFARSAFLQGLLLMPEESIPHFLQSIIPIRNKVTAIADEIGIDMIELCLRYCLSCRSIDSVLIGVDTIQHLEQNIEAAKRGPLPEEIIRKIVNVVPDLPEAVIRPSLWQK